MPRKKKDYKKCKIYKLINDKDDMVYVGHTCQAILAQRKSHHKNKSYRCPTRKVYKHLNEIGWEQVSIVLLEDYPCETEDQAIAREKSWYEKFEKSKLLNTYRPQRTIEEHREEDRERAKTYRVINAEKIKKARKIHRENNKELLNMRNKQWREDNKEYMKQKQKEYQQKKLQERVRCELCDCEIAWTSMPLHRKSKKHQTNLVKQP